MTQTSSQSDDFLKSCRASIDILKKYVPWFEENTGIDHGQTYEELIDKNGKRSIRNLGSHLGKTFHEFVVEIVDSPFYDLEYFTTLERLQPKFPRILSVVPDANLQEACALLTYLIRRERFCDGFHQEAVEDGRFLLVIKRIIEIVETDS